MCLLSDVVCVFTVFTDRDTSAESENDGLEVDGASVEGSCVSDAASVEISGVDDDGVSGDTVGGDSSVTEAGDDKAASNDSGGGCVSLAGGSEVDDDVPSSSTDVVVFEDGRVEDMVPVKCSSAAGSSCIGDGVGIISASVSGEEGGESVSYAVEEEQLASIGGDGLLLLSSISTRLSISDSFIRSPLTDSRIRPSSF